MERKKRKELITMPGKKELVNGKNHKINKKGACGQKLLVTTRWKAKWNRFWPEELKSRLLCGEVMGDGLAKKQKKVRGANGTCQQPRELNATKSPALFGAAQLSSRWTNDLVGL